MTKSFLIVISANNKHKRASTTNTNTNNGIAIIITTKPQARQARNQTPIQQPRTLEPDSRTEGLSTGPKEACDSERL